MGECFFWYRPTQVVPDQWPLNGCVCVCVCACVCVCVMSKCVRAISSCHSAAVNCKGKRKLTILPNTDQTIRPIHSLSSVPLAAAAAGGGGGGGGVVVVVVVVVVATFFNQLCQLQSYINLEIKNLRNKIK